MDLPAMFEWQLLRGVCIQAERDISNKLSGHKHVSSMVNVIYQDTAREM